MSKPLIVCFIDDDKIYQYTVTRSVNLHQLAKKILIFSDGEQAMWYLSDNAGDSEKLPDIIFLDINMPVMDGWEFLEEYALLKPRLAKPIIVYMVSSSVNPIDQERAQSISEISGYLFKPLKADKLKEIVEQVEKIP